MDLYRGGDYSGAVREAEREGLDGLATTLGQEELWQLANAARYAKKGQTSTRILLAVRERFSGYRRAEAATFLLGRVALELNSNPEAARKWFKTYLAQSPNGHLAEEALGRLIDANIKAGKEKEARRSALLYLKRYPKGLFAELAKSVINP